MVPPRSNEAKSNFCTFIPKLIYVSIRAEAPKQIVSPEGDASREADGFEGG